ncbi:MAG: acyl-CoA dehydrogenase [Alphaproteobacteria bacterium]|nr:MAG: acyl-CoA dehydrogenase [Alphaproteobacteria bacterium]
MDMSFSASDLGFRDEVRAFLAAELPQRLRDGMNGTPSVFVEPEIGLEWQRILHARGWLAYQWPVEHGGTGWTPVQRYIFEKECALADAPSLSVLGLKLVGPVIAHYGTPAQKSRFLDRILTGEDLWCQGYSEPGSGSDLASLKTRAIRNGDKYIVNGTKIWTTHAHYADWMFCLARTDPDVKPQAGISFLLIDMKQPGITIRPIIGMAGDHEVNQVFLDDVEALVENRVGEEGQGWTIAKFLLENERGGSCAAPRLIAELDRMERLSLAQPSGINGALGHDTEFSRRMARLKLEAEALEMTELRVLGELAQGRKPGPQTSLIKLVASSLRQHIDELAVEMFGYDGLQLATERPLYGNESPEPIGSKPAQLAMPTYLNSRAWTIFGGSNEVQKNIIAKTVLGL